MHYLECKASVPVRPHISSSSSCLIPPSHETKNETDPSAAVVSSSTLPAFLCARALFWKIGPRGAAFVSTVRVDRDKWPLVVLPLLLFFFLVRV